LAARPFELYTSGGVEKGGTTKEPATRVATITTRRAEAIIRRNLDGMASIIYRDDDEDDVPTQSVVDGKAKTHVVKELLEIAAQPAVKNVRQTSTLEGQWLQQLVDKYSDDYERMMWDRDLNPMQHTPAQLKRKLKKWRETAH